jgi:hypothetical protein
MTDRPSQATPGASSNGLGFNAGVPNVARIYDYLLGGKDNFGPDRSAARRLISAVPDARRAARENRDFLARVVRFLADEGINQFLDIGTGLPTRGHVHEVLKESRPDARVVYVDYDPVVVAHAKALLMDTGQVAVVEADIRYPGHLLTMREVRDMIDFDQPVAVLLIAVLHFVTNRENPWDIVNCIARHLVPGSYVALSHVTGDDMGPFARLSARRAYAGASAPGVDRSLDDIEGFFDDELMLIPPGLVNVARWRADGPAGRTIFYGGIGRKREGSQ